MSDSRPVRIDVVSDVVCPWCFIGKRRLEKALALRPDVPVEVHCRPYFLNAWIPREGISRDGVSHHQVRLARALPGHRAARRAAAAAEGLDLRGRQDQPPAQYARLPPPDPLGRWHRQGRRHEAAADGPLFHRGGDLSTAQCWCRRRPTSASTPRSARGAGQRQGHCRESSRRSRPPRKPASRACPTSSSTANTPSPAPRRPRRWRRRSNRSARRQRSHFSPPPGGGGRNGWARSDDCREGVNS